MEQFHLLNIITQAWAQSRDVGVTSSSLFSAMLLTGKLWNMLLQWIGDLGPQSYLGFSLIYGKD